MSAIAGAYASLTVPQLKTMLATARTAHRREMEDVKAKHAAEVAAQRKALTTAWAKWAAEVQTKESDNAVLRRELHTTRDELERAHALIAEQAQRLAAHDEVAALEQKLRVARRLAS
jgi:hypothetical protein